MTTNALSNRDAGLPSPSLSTSSSFASSSSSSSSSFVFKSKQYSRKPDPMSWISRKPILSQELLLEHANGAVDLGPFAGTVPGFTPFTFLKPEPPSSQAIFVHPRQAEGYQGLPPRLQCPLPPTIEPLRQPPSQASAPIRSSTTIPSRSPHSGSFPSTITPTRPPNAHQNSHSLSLSELIQDESAESDEIEMRALQTKNAFPQTSPQRRRRKKKRRDQENEPQSDTQELAKSTQERDEDEDLEIILTPPKMVFSKNSEKTRNALGTTHDCHAKLTTT